MLKRFLLQWYQRLPIVRELVDLRQRVRELNHSLAALSAIRLLDFDLADHPRYGDARRLLRYQAQVSSQNGEDGIIREIFRRIGDGGRLFVELGVGDGTQNNTAFLLTQGWTGYWIDGNGAFLELLRLRPDLPPGALRSCVARITRENVAGLLQQLGVPPEFDLLSLDIDQNTYYAWEGLRAFRPRVVVVEYNAAVPPDLAWKAHYDAGRGWDRTQNFGASLKALELLGTSLGYSLVGCDITGINAFFVRSDLVGDHFAAPFSAENHYEPARYSLVHRRGHRPALLDRLEDSNR